MSPQPVIEAIDLTKTYNGGYTAVDRLNLTVEEGDIFGFLGPNGAGKTTTILMLLGLTEPTSGTARICGYNSSREPLKVKQLAGYVPEKVGFYEDLTAGYNLTYTAQLNGFPDRVIKERMDEALKIVGLSGLAGKKVGAFSRGMKQRLAIADVLIKQPRIAFLDEPTASVDPLGIEQILDMIARISRERKMTIIMSSHQLTQVQRICTRIAIVSRGHIAVDGRLDELARGTTGDGRFVVEVQMEAITEDIMNRLRQTEGVVRVEREVSQLAVCCHEDIRPQIAETIVSAGGRLLKINLQSFTLEDLYRKYFTG